jgi:hypothetical protein
LEKVPSFLVDHCHTRSGCCEPQQLMVPLPGTPTFPPPQLGMAEEDQRDPGPSLCHHGDTKPIPGFLTIKLQPEQYCLVTADMLVELSVTGSRTHSNFCILHFSLFPGVGFTAGKLPGLGPAVWPWGHEDFHSLNSLLIWEAKSPILKSLFVHLHWRKHNTPGPGQVDPPRTWEGQCGCHQAFRSKHGSL